MHHSDNIFYTLPEELIVLITDFLPDNTNVNNLSQTCKYLH